MNMAQFWDLFVPALSIAALGMIESLLCGASAGKMKKEEINLDLNKVKEGVNENALQALLKNLSNAVIKANVAPIDYKVIEL